MSKGVEFIKDIGMRKPKEDSPKKYRYFLGLCLHCGKEFESQARHFKKLKSCRECSSGIRPKEIYSRTHGLRRHPLYEIWAGMKGRCNNEKELCYKNYGGRGIEVCLGWKIDFKLFYDWSLENGYEKGLQLDRIDNDGNYEPGNCRWVTQYENVNNTDRMRTTNSSGYIGVFKIKTSGRFMAYICVEGKRKHLGIFSTAEEASAAYEKARKEKLLKMRK